MKFAKINLKKIGKVGQYVGMSNFFCCWYNFMVLFEVFNVIGYWYYEFMKCC